MEFDEYDGALDHLRIAVEHQTWEHVGITFGYDFFGVDVEATKPNLTGKVEWDYGGPAVGIHVAW